MKKSILYFLLLFSYASFGQLDAQMADSLYYAGKDWYHEGNYKRAKKDFEKALEINLSLYDSVHLKVVKSYFRLGKNERKLKYLKSALAILNKGLSLAIKLEGEESKRVTEYYIEIAYAYAQSFNLEKSHYYNQKVIRIFKKLYGVESIDVADMYMNVGLTFVRNGDYRQAENYLSKALTIYQKKSAPDSKTFNRIYNNLGWLYRKKGNYEKALEYSKKALKIKLLNYDEYHPSVAKYYGNIADNYYAKGAVEKGLPYMEKALDISRKSLGEDHPQTAGILGDLGDFYAAVGRIEDAKKMMQKNIEINERRLGLTHPYVVSAHNAIGELYEEEKEYDKALEVYQQNLNRYLSHDYRIDHLVSDAYDDIAEVFLKKGALDAALYNNGLALEYLAKNYVFSPSDFSKNPSFHQVESEVDFVYALDAKAYILNERYSKNQNSSDLENALKAIQTAVDAIEKIRRGYSTTEERQTLNEAMHQVFELGVGLAYQMYDKTGDGQYLRLALSFSEKSKASILWQNMNENFALANSGIPAEVMDDIASLRAQIQALEEHFFESDKVAKEKIANQLFNAKRSYEEKIGAIEQYNPAYFKLKYASPEVDIENLKSKTKSEQIAFVEYFYDDHNIYLFVISNGKLKGEKMAYSKALDSAIIGLRDFDVMRFSQKNQNSDYINRLDFLYKNLIQPIWKEIKASKQVVFVPHGVMNYLSFEMLAPQTNKKDFRKLPYLLKNHHIQYAWSLSFYEKKHTQTYDHKYNYLGFAPSFHDKNLAANTDNQSLNYRDNLIDLNYSESEITKANSFFNGNIFIGNEASETSFQQLAPESKIIHLATHALANDQQPMHSGLVFSNQKDTMEDGYLNAYEIYNMKLSAELAVMSACNTGFGKLAEGEGVISLGRAFSYAGCKSVMMSLWMANDQSTSKLIGSFYENLDKGQRKDEALRNAKITYLENADPFTAHPYFWAGIVGVGDMSPLTSQGNNYAWWIGIGTIIFLWLVFKLSIRK